MIGFAPVFLMVIVRLIVRELLSAPACLLTLLIMSIRSESVTSWLCTLPLLTVVGVRMTVGPTPGVLAREVPCTGVGSTRVGVELPAVIGALQAVISKNMGRVRIP